MMFLWARGSFTTKEVASLREKLLNVFEISKSFLKLGHFVTKEF